jgi:hypothetical protein
MEITGGLGTGEGGGGMGRSGNLIKAWIKPQYCVNKPNETAF